jgi:polysaccharide export outer membrane protein
MAASAGCNSDARISVDQLHVYEQEAAHAKVLQVADTKPLALRETQPYRIGPNDVVDSHFVGLTDRLGTNVLRLRVHKDGTVSLPLVGRMKLAGYTLGEAEAAIVRAYVPDIAKDMSVYLELAGPETVTVMVIGAALNRGLVTLRQNERNILYAIAAAGGFNDMTNLKGRVRAITSERPEAVDDLTNVNDVRRALTDPPLESGDVITVETGSPNAIYVTGLVNLPTPIPVPPNSSLSVLRAISAAGGVREYLAVKDATLVRRLADGRQVQVKLPLDDILAGRAPDLEMKPGDILMVPQTVDTMAQEWARANLLIGPFRVGVNYDPLSQYNVNRALDARLVGRNGIVDTIGSDLPLLFRNDLQPLTPTP